MRVRCPLVIIRDPAPSSRPVELGPIIDFPGVLVLFQFSAEILFQLCYNSLVSCILLTLRLVAKKLSHHLFLNSYSGGSWRFLIRIEILDSGLNIVPVLLKICSNGI